jgi:hypothetical protein
MTRAFDLNCLKTERLHLAIFTPITAVGERWEQLTEDIEALVTEELEEHWATTELCWERANRCCEDGVDASNGKTCAVCNGRGELTMLEVAAVLREQAHALFAQREFCMICWASTCTGMCGIDDMKEAA